MESIIARYLGLLHELLQSPSLAFDTSLWGALPPKEGIYRILETGSDWRDSLYIGQSTDLRSRVYRSHFMGSAQVSTLKKKVVESGTCVDEQAVKQYLQDRCLVQYLLIPGDDERTFFEHFTIAVLRPRFND